MANFTKAARDASRAYALWASSPSRLDYAKYATEKIGVLLSHPETNDREKKKLRSWLEWIGEVQDGQA